MESIGKRKTAIEENCNNKKFKINPSDLITQVQNQSGIFGKLVFMHNEWDSPLIMLQNTLNFYNIPINVVKDSSGYILKLGAEEHARGNYKNLQEAKSSLAATVIEKMRQKCFFIIKKDISTTIDRDLKYLNQSTSEPSPELKNCKGHQMMLNMGWTGGGLGINEQGSTDLVPIYENISRQGLGTVNIVEQVRGILKEFSMSEKLTTLVFDPEFTKEERQVIHQMAQKLNLKSKSIGKGTRRLTVSKKVDRYDLVKELLRLGSENESYLLIVPNNFK